MSAPFAVGDQDRSVGSDRLRKTTIRHDLRRAAHHIVSDCERLLADLARPERNAWIDAVDDALVAGRQVLGLIERGLPSTEAELSEAEMRTLTADLRGPQERIVRSMTTVLTLVPTAPFEDLLVADARVIRETALYLTVGTTVKFTAVEATRSIRAEIALTGAKRMGSQTVSDSERILVVDDTEGARRVIVRQLERMGYDVLQFADGRLALQALEQEHIDLVITDIEMPELSGHELLAKIKGDPATQDIPVIVVSGGGELASVVRCIENGAEDYLNKPFEAVVLQARVRKSLERKRLRDQELAYLRRVLQLTAAAEAVENDSFQPESLAALANEEDELGRLARVFNRTVSGLRAQKEQLQHRLAQLRNDIRQSRDYDLPPQTGAESQLAIGDVLSGRYEVLGHLGSGGMGAVFHAHDRELRVNVALKLVSRQLLDSDPTMLERLKMEMRLARRISHRNVVRSHDLGEWEGTYFITMEYVKGLTVRNLLDGRGRLSVASTLAIGTQLADALTVAHDQDVIHRDIKPENLLVDEGGILKVLDFGLARQTQPTPRMTNPGIVIGTPKYMSPEQMSGGVVDARSDLFAAGVVLYECLTGLPPFGGETPSTLLIQMLDGTPPPISHIVPDIPAGLAALIDKLLRANPADRVQSAAEMSEQLRHVV